jgi:hypothetical protein
MAAAVSHCAGSRGASAVFHHQGSPVFGRQQRIGSLLFLEYLRRNGLLFKLNGEPRLLKTAWSRWHYS